MNFILKEIGLLGLGALSLIFLTNANYSFSENAGIYIDDDFYAKSDIISIWGSTIDAPQNLVFISIVDPDGNTVWTEKISVDEEGNFSTLVIAGTHGWIKSGIYELSLESDESNNVVSFFYDSGLQVNPPSAIDEFYVSQEDLILTFTIAIIVVVGIFVFLTRNIILRKKTKYDNLDLDSKKDRDYEKYHSDWSKEEVFGKRTKGSINQKEFNEMLKNKTLPNYYEILGVAQSADSTEIKEKFRILAKEWHPDKRKDSSEKKMSEINNAYEVLSNPTLRGEYDKYLKLL